MAPLLLVLSFSFFPDRLFARNSLPRLINSSGPDLLILRGEDDRGRFGFGFGIIFTLSVSNQNRWSPQSLNGRGFTLTILAWLNDLAPLPQSTFYEGEARILNLDLSLGERVGKYVFV